MMNKKMLLYCAMSVFLTILPVNNWLILAGENSNQEKVYIDLDGDGFNDSTPGEDRGDKVESAALEAKIFSDQSDKSSVELVSFESNVEQGVVKFFSKSEQFNLAKFSIRGIEQCRGESDAKFGSNPGNGIGSGKMNNACVGGVCVE